MSRPTYAAEDPELLSGLVRARVRSTRRTAKPVEALATTDPVAQVLVEVPLAHLDRPFDYAVPASMDADARPGVRVKVRFAGRDASGFLLARSGASEHPGRLTPLRKVVSPEPVLSPAVAELSRLLAERYAGTRADVLRLAVPPRHATAERQPPASSSASPPGDPPGHPPGPAPRPAPGRPPGHPPGPLAFDPDAADHAWAGHRAAPAFLRHLAEGASPRAVWNPPPGTDWPDLLARAVAATLAGGRGSLVCVADHRDLERVDAALLGVLGPGNHVALSAEAGPARRYRDFLAVARGAVRVAVGTRAAAFAPVRELGLVAIWDDGDDLFAEPRAPYPHVRETLLTRAELEGAAALVGGFTRTVEAHQLVHTRWAHALEPDRVLVRRRARIAIAGADERQIERDPHARTARLPAEVTALMRSAIANGPVLVQTPRRGYAAALACERCRTSARCPTCRGPLALGDPTQPPACRWCGTAASGWSCPECGHRGLRAPVVGERRTAEELGRAFAGVPVVRSGGDRVLATVESAPALVVATPGAEPVAEDGYAGVVLLDTWLLLDLPGLGPDAEALRRWGNAVALLRPGGHAIAVGDPGDATLQALVRWDPARAAERDADARREAHLPPSTRLATITGGAGAVDDALTLLAAPAGAQVLGPVAVPSPPGHPGTPLESRAVLCVPRAQGLALSRALGELQRVRSARKLDAVRIQVDPIDI